MRLFLTIIQLLFITFASSGFADGSSTMKRIAKADTKDIAQIFMSFDSLPQFTFKTNNRRVDILFENAIIPGDLELLEPDERIIKYLPTTRNGRTVLSLFFRYRPQKVEVKATPDNKIVAEILLGNQYSRSYQDLSERLKGLTVVESEPIISTNPLLASPYRNNWDEFFSDYEAEITITVPIEFTVPPFPVMAFIPPGLEKNMELLPIELYELAEQELWDDMQPLILEQLRSTREIQDQKLLALTYGEALFRYNDFEGAYKQLYLLQQEYPGEHIGIVSRYLLTLLEAIYNDPYASDYELRKLERLITPTHPIAPYFLISRIETALATHQHDRMRRLLELDEVPFPGTTMKIRELRRGDHFNATDQQVKSYVAYQLLKDTKLLESHPFSLNGFCHSLYKQRKYEQASECYKVLGPQVSDNHSLALITYRKSMSDLKLKQPYEMIDSFARIEDAFPGTEGGYRAALKRTDLRYLNDRGWANQAVKYYRALAARTIDRSTAAEAAFKEALISSLMGDSEQSVQLLMQFLRNFKTTELRDTAQALLIDILPGEMKRHIESGQYMKALVLAKQNRELFENEWLEIDLLADIANAYQKVGIFSEAQRVYLYLIEVVDIEKREGFFLPLIQSVFDQGEYGLVEDFASQYIFNYPEGKDAMTILAIRIRALMAVEQFASALELLPEDLKDDEEMRILAANLFFREAEYSKVVSALDFFLKNGLPTTIAEQFLLAESYFQIGQFADSEKFYSGLVDHEKFGEQSLYRLAQMARDRQDEEKALKLFEKIVEKDSDSLWRTYAEKELEYSKLNERITNMLDG